MDNDERLRVMSNVRRLIKGRLKQPVNWVLYSQIFGTGSTTAYKKCQEICLDPEST